MQSRFYKDKFLSHDSFVLQVITHIVLNKQDSNKIRQFFKYKLKGSIVKEEKIVTEKEFASRRA